MAPLSAEERQEGNAAPQQQTQEERRLYGVSSRARRGRRRGPGRPRLQRGRAPRRAQQGEARHARPAAPAGEFWRSNEEEAERNRGKKRESIRRRSMVFDDVVDADVAAPPLLPLLDPFCLFSKCMKLELYVISTLARRLIAQKKKLAPLFFLSLLRRSL